MQTHFHTQTERLAMDSVQNIFANSGWQVQADEQSGRVEDLVLTSDRGQTYHVVLKAFNEGRSDRVKALFAQALLEARTRAKTDHRQPAVLIWVGNVSPTLVKQLVDFHREYGEDEPFAVLSKSGAKYVHFPGLHHGLEGVDEPINSRWLRHSAPPRLVFSDLTQLMLKLLLAADIKGENLIGLPAEHYKTATELARAARCSTMTATRMVKALKEEGFIETWPSLKLVRRSTLAERWKAAYQKTPLSLPTKFLSPGAPDKQLEKLLLKEDGILGQFAAASALGVGHVHGVPPTVWVPHLMLANSRAVRLIREGERPDLILQEPSFPQSLERGAVIRQGKRVTDIIQTWLDVSAHPARGAEQAAELEHGVLKNVIGDRA